ncbi:unnamed protein product [Owenia fusiformis]|uniref:Uncharacterized protein n=1 Tax=Owenia fusiformis TaxID=6347 RepID=A0A8J1TWW6_OWEFU|nr:unnamed protein product [Owenia fusiformis]
MASGFIGKKGKNKDKKEWANSGSFMNKPVRGWLHPDEQLASEAGVCYGVRYVGCLEVKESMRTLDFDTRTAVAKESISRVCDAAGLKTATKKKKDKKVSKLLGNQPIMQNAGFNINLTITIESLSLMIMESAELIAEHVMPGISFASGGDPDTMDFVAYIAKDPIHGRACHVLECGGGLAQDVITTIGQAFELRFKEFLKNQAKPIELPDRVENPVFGNEAQSMWGSQWGDDPDYYNDRPGAQPPEASAVPSIPPLPEYSAPTSNLQKSDGIYSSVKHKESPIYDNKDGSVGILVDLGSEIGSTKDFESEITTHTNGAVGITMYDNPKASSIEDNDFNPRFDDPVYDNKDKLGGANGQLDPFDMEPFSSNLPTGGAVEAASGSSIGTVPKQAKKDNTPYHEEWFHGKLTRKQTEELLHHEGDFLVRESSNSPGQYVLSGRKNNKTKHLLLVDPQGVVRTKDRTFDSVSHLVCYHMDNNLPIMSQDTELQLRNPIVASDI